MSYVNIYADRWYYSYPQVKNVSVIRCDANGFADDSGAYFKISATRSYSKTFQYGRVDVELHENRCEIGCCYRQLPGGTYSAWNTILAEDNLTTDSVTTIVFGNLDANENYEVIVGVKDTAGSEIYTCIILTAGVFMHKDGEKNSIAIGEMVSEENTVSIAEKFTTIIKGLLKTYGGINFYDSNGKRCAYANSRVMVVQSSSGEVDAVVGAGFVEVGSGTRGYASLNYDHEKNRGYVYIGDPPMNPTDATNKEYVDRFGIEDTDYPGCFYRIVGEEKEWLNPPMADGVEYRTTERHLGKPVYAITFTGAVSDGSEVLGTGSFCTKEQIVSVTGAAYNSSTGEVFNISTGGVLVSLYFDEVGKLRIIGTDVDGGYIVTIKYTKQT